MKDSKKKEYLLQAKSLRKKREQYNEQIRKIAQKRNVLTREINKYESMVQKAEKEALKPKKKRGRKPKNESRVLDSVD